MSGIEASKAGATMQESPMMQFIKRIHCECDRIIESSNIVSGVTDRLAGAIHEDPENSPEIPEPSCEFEEMDRAIVRLAKTTDIMSFQASRLSDRT